MAKLAKEHGGEAVVLAGISTKLHSIDAQDDVNYRQLTKVIVVEYLP